MVFNGKNIEETSSSTNSKSIQRYTELTVIKLRYKVLWYIISMVNMQRSKNSNKVEI